MDGQTYWYFRRQPVYYTYSSTSTFFKNNAQAQAYIPDYDYYQTRASQIHDESKYAGLTDDDEVSELTLSEAEGELLAP